MLRDVVSQAEKGNFSAVCVGLLDGELDGTAFQPGAGANCFVCGRANLKDVIQDVAHYVAGVSLLSDDVGERQEVSQDLTV